ncbi:MAG: hypothetical protein RL481_703 [Pseudomonadota bacterium]|jgi:uncharacterized protein involved in type VI secretion and phage assembly
MSATTHIASPAWWMAGAQLALVKSVQDPQSIGRVQIQLFAADPDGSALVWARVSTPFAGNNYGAFLIPNVGDEVMVLFLGGDARYPIVVGSLWNGSHSLPETLPGDAVDRWTLTGVNGTRIAIVEESSGQEKVEIETPAGAKATLTDANGGEIILTVGGNTLTMGTSGVSIETSGEFSVDASTISLTAGSVSVTSGSSDFSGSITCNALTTPSVTSASYTPGAGNIW